MADSPILHFAEFSPWECEHVLGKRQDTGNRGNGLLVRGSE
jgi:hypothetical protein